MIPAQAVEAAWDKLHENPVRPIGIDYAELEAALEAATPHMLSGAESNADELAAEYRRGYRDGLVDRKQVTASPREWEPGDPIE